MAFILGLLVGLVVGGVLVIVFGKNNKNHIEQVRSEVVAAYNKGNDELKKLAEGWKK